MKPASERFDEERRRQIDAAVVEAERQTAAEIVPVVPSRETQAIVQPLL